MVRTVILAAALATMPRGVAQACVCDHPENLEDALGRADLVFQGYPVARFARRGAWGIAGWDYVFVIQRASEYDGYETSRCSTWHRRRLPVGPDEAVVRALGPPTFEAGGHTPTLVTEAAAGDDFGWPPGAPLPGSDLPPSAADDLGLDERHRVWHGLLLTTGVLLVIYPSIRAGRSDRRRRRDEAT